MLQIGFSYTVSFFGRVPKLDRVFLLWDEHEVLDLSGGGHRRVLNDILRDSLVTILVEPLHSTDGVLALCGWLETCGEGSCTLVEALRRIGYPGIKDLPKHLEPEQVLEFFDVEARTRSTKW